MAVTSEAIRLAADREESDVIARISVARGITPLDVICGFRKMIVYYHSLDVTFSCCGATFRRPDPCLDLISSGWEERPEKARPPKKRYRWRYERPHLKGLIPCCFAEATSTCQPMSREQHRIPRPIGSRGRADGIILGTPGYHGGLSGLVKNALDYIEDLRNNRRPYLEDRPIGCVVTAAGEQGAVTTLAALRSVVHALRGWPTPLGVTIVTSDQVFDATGNCISPRIEMQLRILSQQVVDFARLRARADSESSVGATRGSAFG